MKGQSCAFWSPTTTASARRGSRWPRRSPPSSPGRPARSSSVAPAFEQSGVAHMVSYVRPMRIERLEDRRFAVEGSPADCVLAGLYEVMKDAPPDLVISGRQPRPQRRRGHRLFRHGRRRDGGGAARRAGGRAVAVLRPARRGSRRSLRRGARARRRRCSGGCVDGAAWPTSPVRRSSTTSTSRRCAEPRCAASAPPTRAIAPRRPSGCCAMSRRTAAPSSGSPTATATPTGREGSDSRECHDGFITVTPLQRRPDRARPRRAACAGARIGRSRRHAPRRTADAVRLHPALARGDQRRRAEGDGGDAARGVPRGHLPRPRLRGHAAADRLRPDDQPADGGRADDPGARGDEALQGARGRHRLRLPGGDPRRGWRGGSTPSSATGGWRGAPASCCCRSGCTTSPWCTATARSGCPSRRRSTASSSPPRPRTRRRCCSTSSGPAGSWCCRSGRATRCRR